MYAVMIPFFGMGTDQVINKAVGKPGTDDMALLRGADGTEKY